MNKVRKISREYADKNTCYANDSNLQYKAIVDAVEYGYHQAEKDLSDISWIKEVSGVKDMSRAKEEALKAYPPRSIAANYDTIDRRDAFEYGYLKAEKDLALTWKDIELIVNIDKDIDNEESITSVRNNKEHYKEVLKRFNKMNNEDN